jgi:hypothetical protein
MASFPSDRRRGKLAAIVLLFVIIVAAAAGAGLYFKPRFESEPPRITVTPSADVMGLAPLEIVVSDAGTGL